MADMTQPWPAIDAKWPVVGPPKRLAELLNQVEELDTPALTALAKQIGIRPPDAPGSERWPIVPEYDADDQFICLVWADPSEDEPDHPDNDDDPWPTASAI